MQPKQEEENVLPMYIRKGKRLKNNKLIINFNKLEAHQNQPKDNKRKY